MGTFFTDEQMQEAIVALEDHTAGIWERMKKMALTPDHPNDEVQALEQGAIVRVLTIVLPKVPFVAQGSRSIGGKGTLEYRLGERCAQ